MQKYKEKHNKQTGFKIDILKYLRQIPKTG